MPAKQGSSHRLIGEQPSFAYELFITAVTLFALANHGHLLRDSHVRSRQ